MLLLGCLEKCARFGNTARRSAIEKTVTNRGRPNAVDRFDSFVAGSMQSKGQ